MRDIDQTRSNTRVLAQFEPQGRRYNNEELRLSAQVLAAVTIVSGWHVGRSRLCILKLSVIVEAQSLPIGF